MSDGVANVDSVEGFGFGCFDVVGRVGLSGVDGFLYSVVVVYRFKEANAMRYCYVADRVQAQKDFLSVVMAQTVKANRKEVD